MPAYPVHISATRHDPPPPVAELTTIEADSPQEALELLKRETFVAPPDVKTVWLKVVVSVWPNGNARQVMTTEMPVERVIDLN